MGDLVRQYESYLIPSTTDMFNLSSRNPNMTRKGIVHKSWSGATDNVERPICRVQQVQCMRHLVQYFSFFEWHAVRNKFHGTFKDLWTNVGNKLHVCLVLNAARVMNNLGVKGV
jgi:hypothetical protein